MKDEKPWWGVLAENTPLVLTLIGAVLLVTGAAGRWPTPEVKVSEASWRIALAIVGVIALGIGIWLFLRKETQRDGPRPVLDPKRYGLRITSPVKGASVGQQLLVEGVYETKPPKDVGVKILDLSPNTGRYWPKRSIVEFEDDPKTWRAGPFGMGRIKKGDERILVVAIMDRSGEVYCDYYYEVADQINEMRKQYNDDTIRLLGITSHPDIVECHRVRVIGQ